MRRVAAALWTAAWLVALLAGMPYALWVLVGIPVPRHRLQEEYLREWITLLVVSLLWATWLLMVALLGLHVRATVRRVRMRRLQLANPPEGLAAGLLSAAVVAFTTAGSRGTVTAPPAPPVADTSTQHTPSAQAVRAGDTAAPAATAPITLVADPADQPPATAGRSADLVGDPPFADSGDAGPDPAGPYDTPDGAGSAHGGGPAAGRADSRSDDGQPDQGQPGDGQPGEGRLGLRDGQGGVTLPGGGWVSHDLAAAVSSAAGLLWLRRRRRYKPRQLSPSRGDADLTALPDTAAAIIAALHADDPPDSAPADPVRHPELPYPARARSPAAASSPRAAAFPAAAAAAAGRRGDRPLILADLPAGGVALIGAGALDAARGILATALLSGGPTHSDLASRVVTTTADLAILLERDLLPDGRPAG